MLLEYALKYFLIRQIPHIWRNKQTGILINILKGFRCCYCFGQFKMVLQGILLSSVFQPCLNTPLIFSKFIILFSSSFLPLYMMLHTLPYRFSYRVYYFQNISDSKWKACYLLQRNTNVPVQQFWDSCGDLAVVIIIM